MIAWSNTVKRMLKALFGKGRYQAVQRKNMVLLVDTATGETWYAKQIQGEFDTGLIDNWKRLYFIQSTPRGKKEPF